MAPRGRPSREAVLASLARSLADLENVGGLPRPDELEAFWRGIWLDETHNSTAIEGNTLILRQVETLLEDDRVIGTKNFKEYLEVKAYAEAAEWVYSRAVPGGDADWRVREFIGYAELREIHRLVVEPVWNWFPPEDYVPGEGAGSFRRHEVEPLASGYQPPTWPHVDAHIHNWISSANDPPPEDCHLMEHLAALHAAFERVHPFRDGNGRVGRLATNLMLVRHGYPPIVIHRRDRKKYLRALGHADADERGPLAELFARAVRTSIDGYLLPALAGPHRLVPLTALADKELSHNALAVAAKRERLRAVRQSDRWYSTREWVNEYKRSRGRREPKPALP